MEKPRTSNKPMRTMEQMQIVELGSSKEGRDSSSNNKLRRINKFVTVILTRFELPGQFKQQAYTEKTIQTRMELQQ